MSIFVRSRADARGRATDARRGPVGRSPHHASLRSTKANVLPFGVNAEPEFTEFGCCRDRPRADRRENSQCFEPLRGFARHARARTGCVHCGGIIPHHCFDWVHPSFPIGALPRAPLRPTARPPGPDRGALTFSVPAKRRRLAVPAGFEPATPRFEVSCSIQLSYGTMLMRREGLCALTPTARCASGRPRSCAPA